MAKSAAGFPGRHAGASLKGRVVHGQAGVAGLGFPGRHAGASLKGFYVAGQQVSGHAIPRQTRRGLIEGTNSGADGEINDTPDSPADTPGPH